MKNIDLQFTKEQEQYLSCFFEVLHSKIASIKSIVNITNKSLIDEDGDYTKTVSIEDISRILYGINDALEPLEIELGELYGNVDYLDWKNKNHISYSFWNEVNRLHNQGLSVLEAKQKQTVSKVEANSKQNESKQ
jgi:hypothetical protein